ncbi:pilus assembly protein [Pseudoduganella sp. FT93W]|uniref:Pilus assembly protein n=1 Tax=Duganella fentianensis TaxID=2692177 RepID=A0A845HZB8_9BURK|nr:TadE/TadG family type IV pilus assembly protein [Duganella fentianensis]MYN46232.1 pilus assembly protein [Duganella fentianensis]
MRYRSQSQQYQHGTLAVEFALVLGVFLLLLFGLLAVAQGLYAFNTVQEVSRRAAAAAAKTDFNDAAALQQIRQNAVFRSSPGVLGFAAPISDAHVRIDYLSISRAADGALSLLPMALLPASPAANRVACMADPYSTQCVQFVRVRLCDVADTESCQPVALDSIFPWVQLNIMLTTATTIVKADGLGYMASPL